MSKTVLAELVPTGTLRAAINLGNSLLVSGVSSSGIPQGIAPDLAYEIALCLDVPISFVLFQQPRILAEAVDTGTWDIGLIGAEPERAQQISFTAAYAEIDATYLVTSGSAISDVKDVDRTGTRISVSSGSAYDLWLQRNILHATLVQSQNVSSSIDRFVKDDLEVLAGLRPRLLSEMTNLPGSRVLEGRFMTVQQAVGTSKTNLTGSIFLHAFIEQAKASGLISKLIARHHVQGVSVAPAHNS